MGRPKQFSRCIWEALWGEWWFWSGRPNGGTVVFWRALQISLLVYALGLWAHSFLSAGCPCECYFSWAGLGHDVDKTLPWFAAIFGAIWAALYAQFASQWTYLAGEYNQIRQALATRLPGSDPKDHHLQLWRAGFIEDALALHLATKPMFKPYLRRLLDEDEHNEVRDRFLEHSDYGEDDLDWLVQKLRKK